MTLSCVDYLKGVLDPEKRKKIIDRAFETLQPEAHTFDAIAFRGMSGALVAVPLADKLGKNLMLVRKGENCHSTFSVEGVLSQRYIIVDDLICTGHTIRQILDTIKSVATQKETECKPVGLYLYWHTEIYYTDDTEMEVIEKMAKEDVNSLNGYCSDKFDIPITWSDWKTKSGF